MAGAQPPHARGVLILDSSGETRFAAGIATEPELSAQLRARWREGGRRSARLFPLRVGEAGHAVIGWSSDDATALLVYARAPGDELFEFAATVDFAGDILRHLLSNPYDALTVVDRDGLVRYISPVHERFFGLPAGGGVGQPVTEVIENTRLHEVARTGKAEVGQLQEMRGTTRVVTRVPVLDAAGEIVGAIGQVMFKGPEQLQGLSDELTRLRSEVAYYRRELSTLRSRSYGLEQIVGNSAAIQRLKHQIVKVAPLDVPVLLVGESGTGKELVAHAIHLLSGRRDEQLVMVNAAAMPATLVESELFGYEPGAFTGAERKGRRGKFELADKGTLFFDEIGDMPLEMQAKLLRVLQDGAFERVGGDKSKVSDFRLVSASNRDFEAMIDAGEFRLDLFYRISAITIHLPPLRDRLDDIPILADQALRNFSGRLGAPAKRLSPEAVAYLQRQAWPGNVRQLMHVVERAAVFAEGDSIEPEDFGLAAPATNSIAEPPVVPGVSGASTRSMPVREAKQDVETHLIREAMQRFDGNKKRVAQELGISRSYLYKRLGEMGRV